ncbi:MauE/DoxX family redox-associated membrane protein [Desulfosarcina sp. BuS5]|uniref:MauE/DoxX family redox-associated membrane protein n=1 Tax=Desulfosarcina sp. BuS5 TaxID=933262 RepID=UPI0006869020|nr:MauE/DoxX family redox-associated membrane protein [Desulfosarcina sp. BuS5]
MKHWSHINTLLRIAIGIIFVWASYGKILDPESFGDIIRNYRILPEILINPVSVILPWVEALAGILLISGFLVTGASMVINLMMFTFISVFLINIYRGIDVSCGCFSLSIETTKSMYRYLIRDFIIFLASIWVFIYKLRTDKYILSDNYPILKFGTMPEGGKRKDQ